MSCDPQYAGEGSENACDDEHAYDSDDYEEYYSDDEKADVAVACAAVACGVSVDPSEQEDGDENACNSSGGVRMISAPLSANEITTRSPSQHPVAEYVMMLQHE